jgi:spore germination protein KC
MKMQQIGLVVSLLSFLLAGCWDRIEVNDLALVMASGLDQATGRNIRLTTQIAIPSQGGQSASSSSSQLPFLVVSAVGTDTINAKQKIQEKLSRRLYIPHRRVLIIGEKLARKGIGPILDDFTRAHYSRIDAFVLIAKGTTANALLKIPSQYEGLPMEAVREIERSKTGPAITIKDLVNTVASGTMSPLIPVIEKVSQPNGKATFRISGAAVFRHDQLAGWLDPKKTRGITWLQKEVKRGFITVGLRETPGVISMSLINNTIKIFPKKDHGRLVMHVNAQAEGNIVENTTDLDLMNPENDPRVNQALSDELYKRMITTLNTIQHRYKSDVLNFGEIIHQEYPKEWKKLSTHWDEEFPKLKVIIHTKVTSKHIGMGSQVK